MDSSNDEQLIKEYLNGDEKSFELLVKKYLNPIYNFIVRSIGNRDEANDITQEVFLKVWKNLKKYDQEKSFKPWIFKIARNTTIDYLRKKKDIVFSSIVSSENEDFDFSETIIDIEPSILEKLGQEEKNIKLDEALQKMHPEDKMILILYNSEKITFKEIADLSEESVNTVKSRYLRALKKLRKLII